MARGAESYQLTNIVGRHKSRKWCNSRCLVGTFYKMTQFTLFCKHIFYSQCSAPIIKFYNLNNFSSILAVLLSLLSIFLLFISFFRNTNYSQSFLLLFYLHISGHWTHLLIYVCFLSQPEFANNIFKFYKLCQKNN